ncbi:hypothetical protein BASA60_007449 [Batrachochytrium salamandrivorans]|nr:hypothetical protein BASA60_007449 [Batrachochytrium salamandrivorans]
MWKLFLLMPICIMAAPSPLTHPQNSQQLLQPLPIGSVHQQVAPIEASQPLMHLMMGMLNYTRSSYCIDGLDTWSCATCGGPTHHTTDITLIGDPLFTAFAFTALNIPTHRIVVSFRGTRNLDNWIKDITTATPDSPFPGSPPGAKVHLGFLLAWEQIREEVLEEVNKLVQLYPEFDIVLTGHSLGGALTTMAAMDLITRLNLDPEKMTLFTINQPRTGNNHFAHWVASINFNMVLRVVNQNDLTPHLPPIFTGFSHHPTEIWIAGPNGPTFVCPAYDGESTVQNGLPKISLPWADDDDEDDTPVEGQGCANSLHFGLDITKHLYVWDVPIGVGAC